MDNRQKVEELFQSQCLVTYPSKDDEKQFLIVNQHHYQLLNADEHDKFTDLTLSNIKLSQI